MARPNPFRGVHSFVAKGGMPLTMGTIVLAAIAFVAWWMARLNESWISLVFHSENWWNRPWSIATYAFVQPDFVNLVCGCLMAFFFMGALERAWGRERFLPAYAILLILPPMSLWLGAAVTGIEQTAVGLWLPTACWTAAFGAYRPQSVILIFGIVPVKAMWIGWFASLAVIFYYGSGTPLAGVCAGIAPLTAWALGTNRLGPRLASRKTTSFRDEFGKSLRSKRDSESERLRLRELLERSVRDESDE